MFFFFVFQYYKLIYLFFCLLGDEGTDALEYASSTFLVQTTSQQVLQNQTPRLGTAL